MFVSDSNSAVTCVGLVGALVGSLVGEEVGSGVSLAINSGLSSMLSSVLSSVSPPDRASGKMRPDATVSDEVVGALVGCE